MVVKEMHSRYGNAPNLTFHTFNPGVANTQLMRQGTAFGSGKKRNRAERGWPMDIPSYLPVPRKQKASFFAMVDDAFQHQSGTFVSDGIEKLKAIYDAPARAKLWEEFVEFTGAEWPKVKNEVREVMNA
ncbi:unnamed protein product [Effrenium voratum]|nr:unnamed protein product [Effrenium voratum]